MTVTDLSEWLADHPWAATKEMMQQETDVDVSPIRKILPGDVLDVVQKLRGLMGQIETCSYTLYASFEELGSPGLDKEAEKARHTLELATARMAGLLTSIEKTPYYVELRRETLARRKARADRKKEHA